MKRQYAIWLLKLLLGLGLALALFWWVNRHIGWQALLKPWRLFPLPLLLATLTLNFLGYLLRALRFYLLLGKSAGGRFADYLQINIWHTTAINWLPMRMGEAVFPWLMRRRFNHSLLSASGSLLWIRLLDLFSLLWLGAVVMAAIRAPLWLLPLMAMGGLIPLAWWLHGQVEQRLAGQEKGWRSVLRRLLAGFPAEARQYYQLSGLTLAAWLVKLLAFVLVARAFSPLGVAELLPGVMASELASALPLQGLAGFGTYEAAMVLGMGGGAGLRGETLDTLLATAVNLHLFILASSLLFSLLAGLWAVWRKTITGEKGKKSAENESPRDSAGL